MNSDVKGTLHHIELWVPDLGRAKHGWVQLFQDKYPHAGGPGHYAAYLTNSDGFELELVAVNFRGNRGIQPS